MNPLIVLFIGMMIVFIGLICIVFIVKLMTLLCSFLFVKIGRKKGAGAKPTVDILPSSSPNTGSHAPMSRDERHNLIAAVSAAIGEVMNADNIRITSIRRISDVKNLSDNNDRREIIAAIAAAISESSGVDSNSFRITSIKRLG